MQPRKITSEMVKVMLRVSNPTQNAVADTGGGSNNFFSLDKRKKQVTLVDPSILNGSSAPEDRRVGVAAPKMFAFDAIFSQDDSQSEVCSSALIDVIHAVINGTDGCLFCFGHAGLGKSYTMLGTPETSNTLGIIPCAIAWLFKGINEQKQKTGARFSVRVSAVEICGPTNQLRDLLTGYSNDSEQSPGMYLRDDPLFGNQPPHCELRVPSAEKAAHYLDAAIEGRSPVTKDDSRDSHLLFTLHVYQYSVAGKGGVAGGRSRLHLIDLGNSERGKASGGIPLSGVGNILLAIFNGQKHLPYKEHKLTHLLKDCLSSLTCHAAMIVHVSPFAQNYAETLTTVQLASRIHRMRRRKIKFVSTGTGNGSGGSSGEEQNRTTGTSSEPDPSSSDLSADTVIYVGRADDATDGEHPPVYIPSLNSGDNRCSMSKALRGSSAEQRPTKSPRDTPEKSSTHRPIKSSSQSAKTSPAHTGSPKSSPSRIPSIKKPSDSSKHPSNGASDEQWIDGPRISKSKVAEARHLMKEPCHIKKRETWIDGPMQGAAAEAQGYGYMDSHKKNMIRKWVEHQTFQIQKTKPPTSAHGRVQEGASCSRHGSTKDIPSKEFAQFKTCSSEDVHDDEGILRPLRKQEIVEESVIRTGLKMNSSNPRNDNAIMETDDSALDDQQKRPDDDDEEPELPPALPIIQPLSSREVSLESLDMILKERMLSNAEYNKSCQSNYEQDQMNHSEEDEVLEIIEVEEPLEPVPTMDSCLQVTEEDIALCMGFSENPLPEVDQENPLDHPLRILSQENLTVVSTFTDSMSVYTDLERILPRHRYERYYDDYEDPDNPCPRTNGNVSFDDTTRRKFDQLARLHELYTNRLAKASVGNSQTYQTQQRNNGSQPRLTRCESLTLNDMLYGGSPQDVPDNSSIYSEPAYVQEKFCENCRVSMSRPNTVQNWYENSYLSASTQDLSRHSEVRGGRFHQSRNHCHSKLSTREANLAFLRHPDGASNPNLLKETACRSALPPSASSVTEPLLKHTPPSSIISQPPPSPLPSSERVNRAILSLDTGLKLTQKNEEYDSGHDSTPRTSKHSPAAISRRAESGYDSVVRDSESSSIDSEPTRFSHLGRRGKCKHKHEKSFCSWFLNPFTCKYIDEPPETHF
ncbi:hypothetical protein HUJ04_009218 [Dendroctonus ponderosae]|nr:hypothetical protein HUJ04_009218 [Dendroctonus ponderosae]KAH1026581.1 hypothetical protein HUJ05_000223 [Dendroctonus ponderosae]